MRQIAFFVFYVSACAGFYGKGDAQDGDGGQNKPAPRGAYPLIGVAFAPGGGKLISSRGTAFGDRIYPNGGGSVTIVDTKNFQYISSQNTGSAARVCFLTDDAVVGVSDRYDTRSVARKAAKGSPSERPPSVGGTPFLGNLVVYTESFINRVNDQKVVQWGPAMLLNDDAMPKGSGGFVRQVEPLGASTFALLAGRQPLRIQVSRKGNVIPVTTLDLEQRPYPRRVGSSPDRKFLAACYDDKAQPCLCVFDPDTGKMLASYRQHGDAVPLSVHYSEDGKLIVSRFADGNVGLFVAGKLDDARWVKVGGNEFDNSFGEHRTGGYSDALVHVRENLLIANGYDKVDIYALDTGKLERTFDKVTGYINDMALSPDGTLLAVATGLVGDSADDAVRVFDLKQNKLIKVLH